MPQIQNVNITPGKATPTLHVSQNDVGRIITLNVKDGDGFHDLTGCTVKLQGTKPSSLGFSVAGTVSGHTVTITTTSGMTDEAGSIPTELRITKTGIDIGTANLILEVEKNPHPDGTTDGSVETLIPELTVLVQRIESDAVQIEATMTSLKNSAETAATNAAASAQTASTKAGEAAASAAEVAALIHDLTTPIWFDAEGYLCF